MGGQFLAQDAPKVDFGAAVRPVVVRKVEMGDAEVKRRDHHLALTAPRRGVAEVMPEPQRHER